jgi:hypothetical protein
VLNSSTFSAAFVGGQATPCLLLFTFSVISLTCNNQLHFGTSLGWTCYVHTQQDHGSPNQADHIPTWNKPRLWHIPLIGYMWLISLLRIYDIIHSGLLYLGYELKMFFFSQIQFFFQMEKKMNWDFPDMEFDPKLRATVFRLWI